MKIIVAGDFHLDLTLGSYDFHDDIVEAANEIIDATHSVDLFVQLGDLFHYSDPSPRAYTAALEMIDLCGCPSVWIKGNHDESKGMQADALSPLRKVRFLKDAYFPEFPIIKNVEGLGKFAFVGYVNDSKAKSLDYESAQHMVNDIFDQNEKIDMLFSHLDIRDAYYGDNTFVRGSRLYMPLDVAKKMPYLIVNGHIHIRQKIGPNIHIPGSIVPVSFAEVKQKKGYLLLEL